MKTLTLSLIAGLTATSALASIENTPFDPTRESQTMTQADEQRVVDLDEVVTPLEAEQIPGDTITQYIFDTEETEDRPANLYWR